MQGRTEAAGAAPVLDPSTDLLVQAMRREIGGAARPIRHEAQQAMDWPAVLRDADRHRRRGLLHRGLDALGAGHVPGPVRDRIAFRARRIAARNAFLAGELAGVTRALSASGVAAVPVTGLGLGAAVFGDLEWRGLSHL